MRLQFGDIAFDSETRELTREGSAVRLSPKAFQLLEILIEQRPKAVPKAELMRRLWPDVVVEEANLKNLVVEVRKALGAQSRDLRTVHRFGYAFAGRSLGDEKPVARLIDRDHIYPLRAGENTIGRAAECSIILDATGVSRLHAKIVISDSGAPRMEDLGSKNGTWLNGVRLNAAAPLQSGDRVGIGTTVLIYRPGGKDETTVTLNAHSS